MDAVRLHQSGIDYAVATLGTATTPEHLRRIFRLVPEVVFAFDGDRAGRAGAWRALQQALPEAREGREIRFLFLPRGPRSGHAGRRRKAARPSRRASHGALPLSEYLVRELSEQSDLEPRRRARALCRSARPLFTKVPDGVYRELLLERLAEVVGLPPARLEELWHGRAAPAAVPAPAPPPPASARRSGAGRGSLVRQAIVRLLHYPAIAAEVSPAERAGLDASEEPGVALLRELLDNLKATRLRSPPRSSSRWEGREEVESLQKLLDREEVISDAPAAAGELRAALVRLADQAAGGAWRPSRPRSAPVTCLRRNVRNFKDLYRRLSRREAGGG